MRPDVPFLERICQQPDADMPRLIYADWLDARKDPRGMLIRVQCALAKLSLDDPRRAELQLREDQLLDAHFSEWAEPFRNLATGLKFRRGFVECVNIEARLFLARAPELFALSPIRHVRLLDVGNRIAAIADCPHVGRLSGLTCYAQHLGDVVPRALADSPYVGALTRLELGRNRITDQGAEVLAHSPALGSLTHLDLSENALTDMGAGILSAARGLQALEQLDLHRNEIGPHGLLALGFAPRLERLRMLDLRYNRIGDPRTLDHIRATGPIRINWLNLAHNSIHANRAFTRTVIDSPLFIGIEYLDLGHNELGNRGVDLLARSPGMTSLISLYLNDNQIGDEGMRSLARSIMLGRLTTLDLEQNPMIQDDSIQVLLEQSHLTWLRRLGLPGAGVSHRTRRALHARYAPPRRMLMNGINGFTVA
ncbi:TIGR02996 domain-containing protein [Tuwongella immobilis]|uniref:TIGR02996 domain-containing protein n=1 Tax=Tuwongella immobilis TaxID=692036 RepID=A0A6C2YIM3_9BACT|nr:TIGR02996 domain-containing protein [Tuwongella immobilis]VIP01267.1 leucine-rich repeat-containing protein typical subtype : Leucine-rich repeat-containing protein typical subtype OS=Herpetosiphon aurantiacus (strain ATCC 23779 / DSM 785) GN=Haur_4051 PE=4 SV=1: LRR_8: LRR_6: LRR_6 [Tuwongella immobilis]VTR97960.1 leucine-rich repeat-containing protein typical subtype : Leucine-rich repeat-containing protein typical subtype OS=Herpetosiphon aurantiacus (strain ATCC 23779 / DSM 785) GN=Haur_40